MTANPRFRVVGGTEAPRADEPALHLAPALKVQWLKLIELMQGAGPVTEADRPLFELAATLAAQMAELDALTRSATLMSEHVPAKLEAAGASFDNIVAGIRTMLNTRLVQSPALIIAPRM